MAQKHPRILIMLALIFSPLSAGASDRLNVDATVEDRWAREAIARLTDRYKREAEPARSQREFPLIWKKKITGGTLGRQALDARLAQLQTIGNLTSITRPIVNSMLQQMEGTLDPGDSQSRERLIVMHDLVDELQSTKTNKVTREDRERMDIEAALLKVSRKHSTEIQKAAEEVNRAQSRGCGIYEANQAAKEAYSRFAALQALLEKSPKSSADVKTAANSLRAEHEEAVTDLKDEILKAAKSRDQTDFADVEFNTQEAVQRGVAAVLPVLTKLDDIPAINADPCPSGQMAQWKPDLGVPGMCVLGVGGGVVNCLSVGQRPILAQPLPVLGEVLLQDSQISAGPAGGPEDEEKP